MRTLAVPANDELNPKEMLMDFVKESTADIGQFTATVRVLDVPGIRLTPKMVAQLDVIDRRDLTAFGRIDTPDDSRFKSARAVVIGTDAGGNLALGWVPRLRRHPSLYFGDRPLPYISDAAQEVRPEYGQTARIVEFEGSELMFKDREFELVPAKKMHGALFDPRNEENAQYLRKKIAAYRKETEEIQALLNLPKILLPE